MPQPIRSSKDTWAADAVFLGHLSHRLEHGGGAAGVDNVRCALREALPHHVGDKALVPRVPSSVQRRTSQPMAAKSSSKITAEALRKPMTAVGVLPIVLGYLHHGGHADAAAHHKGLFI